MRALPAFLATILLAASALFLTPTGARAQPPTWLPEPLPPLAGDWMRVRTSNFIVEGDVGEKRLKEVARRCEQFREVLGGQWAESMTAVPAPVTVVAFAYMRDQARFDQAVFESRAAQGSPRGPVMSLALESSANEVYDSVYAVYVNLVLSRITPKLPRWLQTGLLGYYSTFSVTRGGRAARVGLPLGQQAMNYLRSGRPIPLAELIAADASTRQSPGNQMAGRFWAQSWALVHYLQLGSPARAAQAKAFMKRVASGEPGVPAFNGAFPDVEQLEKELNDYIFRAAFLYQELSFEKPIAAAETYRVSRMPKEDVDEVRSCLK